jgi:hypothetical protein
LTSTTNQLTSLLDDYGASLLEQAMVVALTKESPHPNSVRIILQKILDERVDVPLVTFALSKDKRVAGMVIKPHSLNQYGVLDSTTSTEE